MKSEDYILLTTVGEAVAKSIQELLLKNKIPSELHPTPIADAMASEAVHGGLPHEIRVPKKFLEEAKELVNLEK